MTTSIGSKPAWWLMLLLSVAIATYSFAFLAIDDLNQSALKAKLASTPWSMVGHLAGGAVALIIGPFQLHGGLRRRFLAPHRWMGRIYLLAVGASGISGLVMATVSDGGAVTDFGFGMLAVMWLFTGSMAYLRIRQGDVANHRRWMIRNFALTFAAVTLRLQIPALQGLGLSFEALYQVIAWTCWVPNLLVAEWIFLRPARRS
jgi:uncharacterized membrane protein